MTKYTFSKPYTFEGKEYKELEFDLEELKGSDISAAKKEMNGEGIFTPVMATDCDFCAILLARLIKQPREFFSAMPAKDFERLTRLVSGFLAL
ncbi:MAG: phage tail assembly protein [Oxalobacter sp.]|nr:phage tail assembly protein [Oxalobacter sp.]